MSERRTQVMPEDATPAMIKAALDIDWSHEDEMATAHNVWHAMYHAYLRERDIMAPKPERERHGWQPIEVAPRHHKPIWGCDFVRGYDAKILHNGSEWECVSHDNFPMGIGFYPTHWMPLPEAAQ